MVQRQNLKNIAVASLTLGVSLSVCLGAAAQPDRGEWLEVTTDWDGDNWHVDSPHGYEIIGFDYSWSWPDYPEWQKEAAFDGDFDNFAHPLSEPEHMPVWVGLDFGQGVRKEITGVRYAPRDGFEHRGVGATIQGANEPDLSDAVVLYTNEEERPSGQWTTFDIEHPEGFRFVFYEAGIEYDESSTEVAALEFYGQPWIVEEDPSTQMTVAPGDSTELGPVLLYEDYEDEAGFQWYFDGDPLEDETGSGLFLDDVTVDDDGTYTVMVDHPERDTPHEFDIVVSVQDIYAPAAGLAGLTAAGGAMALMGLARIRRKRH